MTVIGKGVWGANDSLRGGGKGERPLYVYARDEFGGRENLLSTCTSGILNLPYRNIEKIKNPECKMNAEVNI